MKNRINYLVISSICITLLFSCKENEKEEVVLVAEETEQTPEKSIPDYHTTDRALNDTIMALDKEFWKAWSTGDVAVIEKMASDNIEFYHDRAGVTKSKENYMELVRKSLEGREEKMEGGSLNDLFEVYRIPGYGALQVSYQQFFTEENPEGTPPSRSVTLWKETEEGWKQEYVFSMHAHPAENFKKLEIKNAETNADIAMRENFKYEFINNMMNARPVDTSGVESKYHVLVHYPDNVVDTILSTGDLHRPPNSPVWIQTSENLITKFQK